MPQSNTLASVMRRICESLHEGDPRIAFVSTTTSVGTATTLVDEDLINTDGDTAGLGQALLRIDETVTAAFSPAATINEGAAFSASDVTLTVNDVTGISVNDVLVIESERLLVTAKPGGNNLTVTRGVDGTTAASHADLTAVTRSGPIAGSVYRVRNTGLTLASGTITVETMRGHVLSGTDYSLWMLANPHSTRRLINRLLGNKERQLITPVTVVTDGDMETTGVTNWTDVGTVSIKAKDTTAANVRHGSQSLHVYVGAASSGVRTGSYVAVQNKTWLLAVTMRVTAGTWTVAAWDQTASANIRTATNTQRAWQTVYFTFSAPASCMNVQVRITGAAADDECYIDNVSLWPIQQSEYELPSGLEDPDDALEIGYFRLLNSSAGSDLYTPEESEWQNWGYERAIVDEGGSHPYRIELETPILYPLYLKTAQPYASLSADTDTTTADLEGLTQHALSKIYERLARENVANTDMFSKYKNLSAMAGAAYLGRVWGTREMNPQPKLKGPSWGSY